MAKVNANNSRRQFVGGALGIALAADALAVVNVANSETTKKLLAIQIGNLGIDTARTNATPAIVQLGEGMRACIARANALGGIRGRQLEFIQLSSKNDPKLFMEYFNQAQKLGALAILCPFGGDNIQRILEEKVLDSAGPVVIGAIPGAEVFRNPGHPKLLHVRARDGRQIAHILGHAKQLGIRRVGMFVVNNEAGRSGATQASVSAKLLGDMALTTFLSEVDQVSIASAVRDFSTSGSECAIVLGPPKFMADSILTMREAKFNKFIYALSYMSPEVLVSVAKEHATNVVISQVFPNPTGIVMPLQREFQTTMRQHLPNITKYSTFHLEGYVCAQVYVESLRRSAVYDGLSLAKTLRASKEIDLGGYPVDFSKNNDGSRFVDIAIVDQSGKLRY